MLKQEDFSWKERKTNNIPTNPLEGYCCIIDTENSARLYIIEPQYPEIDKCCIDRKSNPELYILFEAVGKKATDKDKEHIFYDSINYEGYLFENKTFIRAYKTLQEAQERAYLNYRMIYGYVFSHIINDVEAATANHMCITKD